MRGVVNVRLRCVRVRLHVVRRVNEPAQVEVGSVAKVVVLEQFGDVDLGEPRLAVEGTWGRVRVRVKVRDTST